MKISPLILGKFQIPLIKANHLIGNEKTSNFYFFILLNPLYISTEGAKNNNPSIDY